VQEGASHPDRDAQFQYINRRVKKAQAKNQPCVSVDTKKKELVGNFKNGGKEWNQKFNPIPVKVHDFPTHGQGKAIPYGIYDIKRDEACVNVGITSDTAQFAVNSVDYWLQEMGKLAYPDADVRHFPPGTSKWNKIEHRLFCHITRNWRGRPLTDLDVIVNLIANTTTANGLRVDANLDLRNYEKGIKVTKEQMASLNIKPHRFHGDWNYSVHPRKAL
jgi:hypothetical protein